MSIAPAGTPESPSTRPAAARQQEPQKPKLLDRLREARRARHHSPRTEQNYCHWVKRFIFFHNVRHPGEMGEPEVNNTYRNVVAACRQCNNRKGTTAVEE